jgi:hypothetical protein
MDERIEPGAVTPGGLVDLGFQKTEILLYDCPCFRIVMFVVEGVERIVGGARENGIDYRDSNEIRSPHI